jgi:hypothetical protein
MQKITLLLISTFTVTLLFAQEKYMTSVDELQTLTETVTQLFVDNEVSTAFSTISPYWPLPENEFDALETKTLKYMNVFDETYGASLGFVRVREEKIADVAIRHIYLVRYSYTAIRLIFTYYRSDNGWLLNAFKWDSDFAEEFRQE